jgi:uncharacterized protein (DUF486 family)
MIALRIGYMAQSAYKMATLQSLVDLQVFSNSFELRRRIRTHTVTAATQDELIAESETTTEHSRAENLL